MTGSRWIVPGGCTSPPPLDARGRNENPGEGRRSEPARHDPNAPVHRPSMNVGQRPPPTPASPTRVLPMDLQVGDRLADETGEWEVVSRRYTSNAGKDAHARVQKVGQPEVTELRTWGAHERISVKRASAEEGKR